MIRKFSTGYLLLILLAFSASAKDNWLNGGAGIEAVGSININAGMNDAWYSPTTDGQGFFITVFPDQGFVSLAWFTYDTVLPPADATANLGDPGHRWLTAGGLIVDQQVTMDIEMTSGGVFDTSSEIKRTDPPGSDGTITLSFGSCNSGTITYDIPSINRQGTVNIQRVAQDNIALCEALTPRSTACSQGPLDAPLPNCAPEALESTGDLAQDCVNRVNQLRWECQCLPPLERWTEGEACASQQAEYDSVNGTHAGFRDKICSPSGAQNECPGYSSTGQVISLCLQQMWDEGPGEWPAHGHYINMTNPDHSAVACGFYETDSNKAWSVQNFH